MSLPLASENSNGIEHQDDIPVLFIGKELFFSNQTLRNVQSEFGVTARRCDCLGQAPDITDVDISSLRMLVVDQSMIEDLLSKPQYYVKASGSGCLSFAYRSESAARSLFERWDRRRYGDIGYLPMNVGPDVWRAVLRLLMNDQKYLPACFAECVNPNTNGRAASGSATEERLEPSPPDTRNEALFHKLTRREKQVLRLVSHGESNKIVASRLGITEHTVKLHMHNVVGKIGVNNRTAAAHFYFEVAPETARQQHIDQ